MTLGAGAIMRGPRVQRCAAPASGKAVVRLTVSIAIIEVIVFNGTAAVIAR